MQCRNGARAPALRRHRYHSFEKAGLALET
jgi:hypothetical protein